MLLCVASSGPTGWQSPAVGFFEHLAPASWTSSKISNVEVSMFSTGEGNICCSNKRSTINSKMLLLCRWHCQWSVPRRPSATCADVCGNETTYRSGFCVLLHLSKGVTGFTLFLAAAVMHVAPLIVSMPICNETEEMTTARWCLVNYIRAEHMARRTRWVEVSWVHIVVFRKKAQPKNSKSSKNVEVDS